MLRPRQLAPFLALALLTVGVPAAADGGLAPDVTLKVAPEGFVVPSHWAAGNDATWIIDPSETTTFNDRDGVAGCTLAVTDADGDDAVDGGEVLDAATADGCITGWDATYDDQFGRFVTSVDGLQAQGWPASWWLLQIDGQAADVGIDGMDLGDGESLELVHVVGP